MPEASATIVVNAIAAYVSVGLAIGLPFAIRGVNRVDARAAGAGWPFRALILPGCVILWPLVTRRWLRARRGEP